MHDPDGSKPDLLAQYLKGELPALARVREIARWVVAQRGYFIPEPEREDLLQEVLLNVYRAASKEGFRLQHGAEAFVRSVAHRRCIDWVRRHRRVVEAGVKPNNPRPSSPEDEVVATERLRLARRVLVSLPEACRELIVRRTVEGRSYAEISRLEGRSEQALRNQLYKCLKKAQEMFRDLESARVDGES